MTMATIMETVHTNSLFVIENGKILLGMKKRGFGVGRWNGFGGKITPGENSQEAAKREFTEECGLVAEEIEQFGNFEFVYEGKDKTVVMDLFVVKKYSGELTETEEMRPQWFEIENIPYDQMWPDDKFWLPQVLAGNKVKGNFLFEGYDKILKHSVEVTSPADVISSANKANQ